MLNQKKMTSSRALVALAVALLAASTGKVPLLSPPVKAVLSFVLPASLGGGSGGVFSSGGDADDDGSTGGGGQFRANRLLSIALRNATSDYDEVRGEGSSLLCSLLEGQAAERGGAGKQADFHHRSSFPPLARSLAPPPTEKNSNKMRKTHLFFFLSSAPHTQSPARLHRLRVVQVARARRRRRGGVHRVSENQGEEVRAGKEFRRRPPPPRRRRFLDYSPPLLVSGQRGGRAALWLRIQSDP